MKLIFSLLLLVLSATAGAAEIYALYVSLTIPLQDPAAWTLSIDPTFAIYTSVINYEAHAAMALPHLIVRAEEMSKKVGTRWYEDVMQEEYLHTRQWDFFGPFFPVIYVMMPDAFEPYSVWDKSKTYYNHDFMWIPPDNTRRCPFLRVERNSFSIIPCYSRALRH